MPIISTHSTQNVHAAVCTDQPCCTSRVSRMCVDDALDNAAARMHLPTTSTNDRPYLYLQLPSKPHTCLQCCASAARRTPLPSCCACGWWLQVVAALRCCATTELCYTASDDTSKACAHLLAVLCSSSLMNTVPRNVFPVPGGP